jgi:hypothetical protein
MYSFGNKRQAGSFQKKKAGRFIIASPYISGSLELNKLQRR